MFCYIFHNAPIAQLVEQLPLKETVPGPSPGGRTETGLLLNHHFVRFLDGLILFGCDNTLLQELKEIQKEGQERILL